MVEAVSSGQSRSILSNQGIMKGLFQASWTSLPKEEGIQGDEDKLGEYERQLSQYDPIVVKSFDFQNNNYTEGYFERICPWINSFNRVNEAQKQRFSKYVEDEFIPDLEKNGIKVAEIYAGDERNYFKLMDYVNSVYFSSPASVDY